MGWWVGEGLVICNMRHRPKTKTALNASFKALRTCPSEVVGPEAFGQGTQKPIGECKDAALAIKDFRFLAEKNNFHRKCPLQPIPKTSQFQSSDYA